MNVLAAAQALNRKASEQKWYHFCDHTLAFSDPCYNQLLELWRKKAAGRAMPARSEITPRDLKDILRHVLLFERISQNPSRYKVRLLGTGLHDMAGELTGKMIDDVIPPEHLPRWIECGDLILDGGQPMRFLGRVHLEGREYLDAENLFVPLANDQGEPTFVLGMCRYTPRRNQNEQSWESQIAAIPGALL